MSQAPDEARRLYERGVERHDAHEYPQALENYSRSIALDSTFSWAYHNRARILAHLGQSGRAMSDYRKALALNPDDEDAEQALVEAGEMSPLDMARRGWLPAASKKMDILTYLVIGLALLGWLAYLAMLDDDFYRTVRTAALAAALAIVGFTVLRARLHALWTQSFAAMSWKEYILVYPIVACAAVAWLFHDVPRQFFLQSVGMLALELGLAACGLATVSTSLGEFIDWVRGKNRRYILAGPEGVIVREGQNKTYWYM